MTPRTRVPWLLLCSTLLACAHANHAPPVVASRAPLAAASDPHLVEMTADPTTTLVLASATTELGIRVRIQASELPPARRAALDLALVLDTSGSMEGPAIEALRTSARKLAEKLRDGDRLSVVVFHSKAEVLVPNVVIRAANRAAIDHAIAGIHATGTTDLAGGLAAGLAQLQAGFLPNGINRIVLLSDGVPNSEAQLPALVANVRQAGVSITSLGFGIDYATTLMTQLARDTGGGFHYLATADDVGKVFDAELVKMSTAVARNLQLAIEPGPGVTITAMPGLVPGPDGKLYAAIGDLPAGETRDLMIPITVAARGAGSTAELVQATLTFDDVIGKSGQRTRDAFVAVKTSKDTAAIKKAVAIDLEVARIRATAAAAILQAITLARSGQVRPARQGLGTATAAVKAAAAKYPELAELVTQLEEVDHELAQIVATVQRVVRDQPPQPAMAPMPETESALRTTEDKASATLRGE
ncbi:MAG: VWA domain-containing protein [Deltaproteobacteria bacterium]